MRPSLATLFGHTRHWWLTSATWFGYMRHWWFTSRRVLAIHVTDDSHQWCVLAIHVFYITDDCLDVSLICFSKIVHFACKCSMKRWQFYLDWITTGSGWWLVHYSSFFFWKWSGGDKGFWPLCTNKKGEGEKPKDNKGTRKERKKMSIWTANGLTLRKHWLSILATLGSSIFGA